MMRRRIREVPLCPRVLYHIPFCLPLPYLTVPFPLPNPWWPFHCLHWWLCPIRVHVSTVLAVEALLGWGMEIWFQKDRWNLTQKTETCVVSMFFCPSSFCLSLWTLFCLRSSSNEFQGLFDEKFSKALLNWFAKIVLHLLTKLTAFAAPFCQVEFTFFQSILDILGCSECCDGVAERCNHVIHVKCPLNSLQRIWVIFDFVFGCLLQNRICGSWWVPGSKDVSLVFVHL